MTVEIKEAIKAIKEECLVALIPNVRKRIARTDEIRLSDVLWLARNTAQRETQSKLYFSEGMKAIITSWDLENDDLKLQHDHTILITAQMINPPITNEDNK